MIAKSVWSILRREKESIAFLIDLNCQTKAERVIVGEMCIIQGQVDPLVKPDSGDAGF